MVENLKAVRMSLLSSCRKPEALNEFFVSRPRYLAFKRIPTVSPALPRPCLNSHYFILPTQPCEVNFMTKILALTACIIILVSPFISSVLHSKLLCATISVSVKWDYSA